MVGSMNAKEADIDLYNLVQSVAQDSQLKSLYPLKVILGPRDSLPAFTRGMARINPSIGISTGLRRAFPKSQLKAIIAHECGHIKHDDAFKIEMMCALLGGNLFGIIFAVNHYMARYSFSFDFETGNIFSSRNAKSLGLLTVVAALVKLGSIYIERMIQRNMEFAADLHAANLCGADALISFFQGWRNYDEFGTNNRLLVWLMSFGRHSREDSLYSKLPQCRANFLGSVKGQGLGLLQWLQCVGESLSQMLQMGSLSTHPSFDERIQRIKKTFS